MRIEIRLILEAEAAGDATERTIRRAVLPEIEYLLQHYEREPLTHIENGRQVPVFVRSVRELTEDDIDPIAALPEADRDRIEQVSAALEADDNHALLTALADYHSDWRRITRAPRSLRILHLALFASAARAILRRRPDG